MSFLIPENQGEPIAPTRAPAPTRWQRFQAAREQTALSMDSWGRIDQEREQLVGEITEKLGPDDAPVPFMMPGLPGTNARRVVDARVERALERAAAMKQSPDQIALEGIPLDRESFDAEIERRMRAEYAEAAEVLQMAPEGGWLPELMGALSAGVTDHTTIATLPVGAGPGMGIRTAMLAEGTVGVIAEGMSMPGQFEAAQVLGIEDPDVLANLALSGGLSAALGGVQQGAARYWNRQLEQKAAAQGVRVDDRSATEHEAQIRTAAEDLDRGAPSSIAEAAGRGSDPEATAEAGAEGAGASAGAGAMPSSARMERIVDAMIGAESGGRANARNPNSSAGGLGQIIDSTWLDLIRRYRPDMMQGRSRNQVLGLKFNAGLNREMTLRYAEENAAKLQAAGHAVTPGNVYLAHFLGPQGALRALSLPPSAPIGAVMSRAAIAANRGVRINGKPIASFTMADLRNWATYKTRSAFGAEDVDAPPVFTGTARGYTQAGQVTAGDRRIDVVYEVVDASMLRAASGDLQPRDRARVSSDEQVAEIAAKLDPVRLMPSPEADRGAPIVGPDNVIESGNGRVMAIARAAERHPERFEAYVQQIRDAGFDIPQGVERPVLVGRRQTELDDEARRGFVIDANSSTIARMSATERARADARAIDADALALFDARKPIGDQTNRAFVGRALAGLPQAERAGLTDAKGRLNAEGVRRLQQMVFARAYDAEDIVARYAETDAGELRSLIEALEQAAPEWAALRAAIGNGQVRPEFDITVPMLDALRLIANARTLAGQSNLSLSAAVQELLSEVDLLKGAVDPLTAALVGKFWTGKGVARADDVAGFLSRYAAEARKVGSVQDGLFGTGPTLAEVLRRLDAKAFGDLPDDYAPRAPAPERMARPLEPMPAELEQGASAPLVIEADRLAAESLREQIEATRIEPASGTAETAEKPAVALDFDGTLESVMSPEDITMPIDPALPMDQQRAMIEKMTRENRGIVSDLIKEIDAAFGTRSGDNVKALSKVTQKANRPSILAKKPWHTVAHIRDSYRFKTILDRIEDVPGIFDLILKRGIEIVKIDTGKLFSPGEWGWRIIAFDLRMPNGQLVEYYLPVKELEAQKKAEGHLIFEEWRNKTPDQILAQNAEYMAAIRRSFEGYDAAFSAALARMGVSRAEAEASWINAESSIREAARNSASSSGMTTSSSVRGEETQVPSRSRSAIAEPENRSARGVPSSTSAKFVMGNTSTPEISAGGRSVNQASLRADIEAARADAEDIMIPMGEGQEARSVRELLNEIEDDEDLAEVLALCKVGGARP